MQKKKKKKKNRPVIVRKTCLRAKNKYKAVRGSKTPALIGTNTMRILAVLLLKKMLCFHCTFPTVLPFKSFSILIITSKIFRFKNIEVFSLNHVMLNVMFE